MTTVPFSTLFPGYEILGELGRSNARVLKARHLATGDLVAIKHFALNTDAETLRRFQRESEIMTGIQHPNVVKVREVQLEAEMPYIVMELIEGGSVRNLLQQQERLDHATVIRLGLQMASSFKAIHAAGIIHRDIKPENILYRLLPSGELHFLLTDFGVARLHEQSSTITGQSLLTYEYASPEQFNNPKSVGLATDYYSLGVVLYECLTGRVPFSMAEHAGIVTFMTQVLTETPVPLATIDASLAPFTNAVEPLLVKDANARLRDADELTWLLKQTELTLLQARRAPVSPTPAGQNVTQIAPVRAVAAGSEPRQTTTSATPVSEAPPFWNTSKLIALTLAVLLGVAGLYYAFKPADKTETGTLMSGPVNDELVTGDPVADSIRRAEEEAEEQEKLRQEAVAAVKSLSVKATDFKVGLFGGIKDLQLQLSNPSRIPFTYVLVKVDYIKDQGGVYKSERVYFNNVEPTSSPMRAAPNSDRGTRVRCEIIGYESPRIPRSLDSPTVPEVDSEVPTDTSVSVDSTAKADTTEETDMPR
jgi:serine/threonine-protein kinase